MEKLYKEQKNSLYKIQKETGLSKYTLYRYAKGIANIRNMRFDTLKKIADIEEIDPISLLNKVENYQNNKKSIDIIQ